MMIGSKKMVVRVGFGILFVILLYLLIMLGLFTRAEAEPRLIPRELLFGNPVKAAPSLSRDGSNIAYLAPLDGVLNIWVRTVGEEDDHAITSDKKRGITDYFWRQNGKEILYVQDTDGDENWRLYSVNITTNEVKSLTPFEGVQVRIVAHEKDFPDEALLAINQRDPSIHDVYRLDLNTGELELVEENPGNFTGWIPDPDLVIRGAMVAEEDGSDTLWVRDTKDDAWRAFASWTLEDAMASGPLGFTKDGKSMYLKDSRGVNTGRLTQVVLDGTDTKVIASDPDYDVGSVMVHPDTRDIEMVGFTKARREWLVLDATLKGDIQRLQTLDEGDFFIASRDHARDKWIVGFSNDDGPVNYYFYDRTSQKSRFLFSNQPELNKYALSEMEPVSIKSRDGFTLHGYLTLPSGAGRFDLPLVLLVHGGPWSRDVWGYNPRAQWLANRGYAALQINYRGSTGYGKVFVNAGDREWGRKMHEDLVDAINWVVDQGIADPNRLAIFGGSYGGYAALVGATFTPDLFRCAVSIVGPSNLVSFIQSTPPYWKNFLAMIYRRVGNPNTEIDFLKSRSPLFRVDQIQIPLLIAQGANDPRVVQAESEQIVAAMKEKGLDYEYLLFPDEGHGFVRPENRLKFYAAAEKFLAKHLGGRYKE
jgi:dipeptidyl aminopeptidase/acylaminoacyl peptidase